jgi:type I restriction-modification system DNA methylase subunit
MKVYTNNHYVKDFINVLDKIKPSKHRHEIYSDWLILASATLYTWKKDKSVEEEYLQIASQYTTNELEQHAQLLAITVEALEEKDQDFLGEVFTHGELTNSRSGQFFTPYHISYLMAEMSIGEKELPKNRVLRISDPCCGAGGMLVATASVLKKQNINYQQDAIFYATDIDPRCARMTFIQMSLLAAPAVIICGNSLTFEVYWQRETIGFHMAGMEYRLKAEIMLEKIKEIGQEKPVHAQEKISTEIKLSASRKIMQGELFAMEEIA